MTSAMLGYLLGSVMMLLGIAVGYTLAMLRQRRDKSDD